MAGKAPRIKVSAPQARTALRKAVADAARAQPPQDLVRVKTDDLHALLEENREQRSRIAALWREMERELPLEWDGGEA